MSRIRFSQKAEKKLKKGEKLKTITNEEIEVIVLRTVSGTILGTISGQECVG